MTVNSKELPPPKWNRKFGYFRDAEKTLRKFSEMFEK